MEKKEQPDKGCHKDIYFGEGELWNRIEALVKKRQDQGLPDVSPSSIIRLCLELALPVLEQAKATVKEVVFRNELTNVHVKKTAKTYRVAVDNLQDGENVQVGVSCFAKGKDGKTLKLYKRTMFGRKGLKISTKNKG